MVAGAQKADLLSDLAGSADRAVSEGKSLDAFRQDFRALVERNGWTGWTGEGSKKGVAWRTRIIYQTNAKTSYNAGRYAQLHEGGFKYWVYHHNDSVKQPRPKHLAWDGLTLPVTHAFWDTHAPANGWGCQCYVSGARSERGARRLGGDPDKALPKHWNTTDPKTGAPVGIDKGWDYQPGSTVSDTVRAMAAKTQQWDYTLAKAYMQGVPESVRDSLATSYRSLPSVAADTRLYAQRVLEERTQLDIPPYRTLGLLTADDITRIEVLLGKDVAGFDYALDAFAVRHIEGRHGKEAETRSGQRGVTAKDYEVLPQLINEGGQLVAAGKATKTGNPLVKRRLTLGGEGYEAVFELRNGRKMLALQSFYIIEK
nr:phage minor head protein [Sedimenticola hydrogenitrophicus]